MKTIMKTIKEIAVDIITDDSNLEKYMEECGFMKDSHSEIEFVCDVDLELPMGGDDQLHVTFVYLDDDGDTQYGNFYFCMRGGKLHGDF